MDNVLLLLWSVLALFPVAALTVVCYLALRRSALPLLELVLLWLVATLASAAWTVMDGWIGFLTAAFAAAIATGIPLLLAGAVLWLAGHRSWTNRTAVLGAFGIAIVPALASPAVAFALICLFAGQCI